MKSSKYIILGFILIVGLGSCKKWLDVNTDPDNPNNQSVPIQNKLSWIENYWKEPAGVANVRTACIAGVYYAIAANQNSLSTTWQALNGNSTTPYQAFFVGVSSNITDLYNAAQKQGAYHYMAAADVFHALGYMEMLDLYGEMPYTQAGTGIPSPVPDDGKTIYNGCMARLNEAISLFSKSQQTGAPALSAGDILNNGDVNKWLKLCWGLKARYMLKLSKKSDLYNADSILYCLSKGPQSNADNTVEQHFNNSNATDFLEGDPVSANGNFDFSAISSSNPRISEYYYNLLTNIRGAGVVDPRMPKIVPASMANVQLNASTGKVASFTWLRSIGVNSYNTTDKNPSPLGFPNRLVKGGAASIQTVTYTATPTNVIYTITNGTDHTNFVAALALSGRQTPRDYKDSTVNLVRVTYWPGSIYIASNNYIYAADTLYVNLKGNSLATTNVSQPSNDVTWYPNLAAYNAGVVASTGSFQIRAISDMELLMYHEMCFIKAEVYLRKGDPANAYTAYRAGIQAHLDYMQAKLNQWKGSYDKTSSGIGNPDMGPMDPAAIATYMASNAVAQGAGALTMSDIMLQKYIAMGVSIENWNDMRRFNFSAGSVGSFGVIYPGYQRGPLFTGQAQLTGAAPSDPRYWIRRWALPPVYEIQYNFINTTTLNPHATDANIWSMPVWWDCATDDEYYGYLRK
ncbi:MAG TPA: SusD/RagB family nutrient-binding outer membrane lipoprotein [Chitinophagaceae bacterium]|nr:SusD/RagB family nutrient-binding outer membrane lipoprotein [Chitinophagaceae bacterium]